MFFKRIIITAIVFVAAAALAPAAFAMIDAMPDPPQDLRSPDARDAGRGIVVSETPRVVAPAGRAIDVSGAGFPWLEAGLAAALALALIALGTGALVRRRAAASV